MKTAHFHTDEKIVHAGERKFVAAVVKAPRFSIEPQIGEMMLNVFGGLVLEQHLLRGLKLRGIERADELAGLASTLSFSVLVVQVRDWRGAIDSLRRDLEDLKFTNFAVVAHWDAEERYWRSAFPAHPSFDVHPILANREAIVQFSETFLATLTAATEKLRAQHPPKAE